MPRTETPEQRQQRLQRHLREVDVLGANIERQWRGGIMRPEPGRRPVEAPGQTPTRSLPHRMPRTETPQQRQQRLDRECAEMRELQERHSREFRQTGNIIRR